MDDFICDHCGTTEATTLYNGWFYATSRSNPMSYGTADSGRMVRMHVCEPCLKKLFCEHRTKLDKLPF